MSKPRVKDMRKLVRLGKYLIGRERYVLKFDYQGEVKKLDVWTDTDYAGCRETRKSTSGGTIHFGKHQLKFWSSTQKIIALSSGEAEYYGIVKGSAEAIGSRSILEDMGIRVAIRVKEDSTAAKGVASRSGLGKVRHIEVNQLWVQEKVRSKEIEICKVDGKDNLADALTKHLESEDIAKHIRGVGGEIAKGRHKIMPEVANRSKEQDQDLLDFGDEPDND